MPAFIGRLQALGLGKEVTSGTAVAATAWLPKVSGSFSPEFEFAENSAGYGVIDKIRDTATVKNKTKIDLEGYVDDNTFGHFLNATFANNYSCVAFPISAIVGTFTVGEVVTESVSLATGTLRRSDQGAGSPTLYIAPLVGTFTGGQTLTGGTSGATALGGAIQSPSTVRTHVFPLLQSNTHDTYTIYGSDPIGAERATYCALDTLEIEASVGDYAKFKSSFMGKKLQSTGAQTPSYSADNFFLSKFIEVKFASDFNSLDAATEICGSRVKLSFKKNLEDFQCFGDTDITAVYNKSFEVEGELELIYDSTTYRDLVANSTKQAVRITMTNTDVTIGTTNPSIQFDLPIGTFKAWSRTSGNDDLITQTLGFVGSYDTTRTSSIEAYLRNGVLTSY